MYIFVVATCWNISKSRDEWIGTSFYSTHFRHQLTGAESFFNLAYLYFRHLGGYEEAEALYRRALAIREERLSKDDPSLIHALQEYDDFLNAQGRHDEAEKLEARIRQ